MNPPSTARILTVQSLSALLIEYLTRDQDAGRSIDASRLEALLRASLQGITGLDLGAQKALPISGLTPEEASAREGSFEKPLPSTTGESPGFTALGCQIGGSHYKNHKIQHVEFCQLNQLTWCESSAMKYLMRHRKKNKVQDVDKAIHYCLLLREIEYPDAPEIDLPVGKKA